MLDQWKKRQKRAGNIPYDNYLLTVGEERYVALKIYWVVLCRDRGERCGAANKQATYKRGHRADLTRK